MKFHSFRGAIGLTAGLRFISYSKILSRFEMDAEAQTTRSRSPSSRSDSPSSGSPSPRSNREDHSAQTSRGVSPFGKVNQQTLANFAEKKVRRDFIRKVYGILTVQLCATVLIIAAFLFIPPLYEVASRNPWLWIVALLMTIICLVALACFPTVRRSYPSNLIFLAVFTLCESFLLGTVTCSYQTGEVLTAVSICAVVVVCLTLFAMQTRIDFTMLSGILFVCLIVLVCFSLLLIFVNSPFLHLAYACLGALLFSVYLVVDTQLMLGGNHMYSISPEDYIFAALNLYLDIVNIFLFILQMIGRMRKF